MKKDKLLISNLILAIIIILFPLCSFADIDLPESPPSFYLDDLHMLDNKTKENISQTNRELEQKTGSQVIVATIKNKSGLPASDLAAKIFNKWGIGDQKKKNGVLILLTEDDFSGDHEIFISSGYGIEGRLNDGKIGRIIDNFMIEDLRKGNYSTAINEGFNSIVGEIADEYEIKLDSNYDYYLETNEQAYSGGISIFSLLMILIVFIVLSNMFTRISLYGNPRGRYYRSYPGRRGRRGYYGSPFRRNNWDDDFNPFGNSSFGNSSFGGSSDGFKGGGGSTGGGGAGRKF